MSEKKNSLDLSNLNNTPRNYILRKQRSHELPISDVDTELSIDDDNPYNRKKTRSFNSFLSMINRSSNGSSRNNSFTAQINNMFKKKNSSHSLRPMTMHEFIDDKGSQNGVASHIAISPDGQYICTFDSKNLEFKIFDTDTTIRYLDKRVDTDEFVKIPKISASNDDSLASYRIEQGALHEYKFDMDFKEYKETKETQQRTSLNISNSENQNNLHDDDEISLESMDRKLSQEIRRAESASRKFPSWSLAISNMMEHQNQHVVFVVISAIVEADMKKKTSEDEEEEIFPNRSRYKNDEYAINVEENSVHPSESAEEIPDPQSIASTKSEGATAIFRIEFDKNDHSLIRRPHRISQHTCSKIAGIVTFVKQESNRSYIRNFKLSDQNYLIEEFMTTACIVINAEGIFKINYFQQYEGTFDIITFSSKLKEEKFSFPKRLEKELKTQYRSKNCMDRLLSCFYNNYFFVDQYKDGTHTIEMYNLLTMEQEQIFIIQHEEKVSSNNTSNHISSVFAISRNKQLIACSNGEKSVTLFWLENGLDVGVKEFGTETRILFLEFIDNDERLLIITEDEVSNIKEVSKVTNDENEVILHTIAENSKNKQKQIESDENHKLSIIMEENDEIEIENDNSKKEKEKYKNKDNLRPKITRKKSSYKDIIESKKVTKINVWDLFSSADNAIRTEMSGDLFPSKENYHSRMARIPGKLYHMKEDGSVFSIMERDGFANLVKGEEKDETRSFGCTIFLSFEVTRDQKEHMPCEYAKNDEDAKLHKVFSRNKEPRKSGHNVIVNNEEPWVDINEYHRTSVFLDKEETLQLIIGHSTVQIWRSLPKGEKSDKKGAVLEYIWANNIPNECEYEDSRLRIQYLWVGDRAFSLNLYWQYFEGFTLMKVTERLSYPCKDGHVTPVLHACKALEHLNSRKSGVIDYKMMLEFEQLVESTSRIVWRFIKKKPDAFKLMDVRYDVMTHLVQGGCNFLIKFILFGDLVNEEFKHDKKGSKKKKKDGDKHYHNNKRILHIPKTRQWISEIEPQIKIAESLQIKAACPDRFLSFIMKVILWFYLLITCKNKKKEKKIKKKSKRDVIPSTVLEWAIDHCKDKERKDAVVVGYLLEYYSENALHHIGWMITISKALPLLYRYNLDYYVKPLFYKDCFGDKELTHYDPSEIIPEHSKPRRNKTQDFKAFKPFTKIVSDKNHKPIIQKLFEFIIIKLPRYYIDFVDNFDNDRAPPPIALRIVPLPNFTVDNIPRNHLKYDWLSNLLRLLKILIIPRGYMIGKGDKKLLSPFVQVVRYEKDNDIFDNPAMEAIIDFRWRAARNYFLQIFFAFVAYAVCFGVIVWAYMSKLEATGNLITFLMCVIGCFYYLAYYLIAVELKQAWHHGIRNSLNVGNLFDIVSIVAPCVVMSIFVASSFQLSDGFGHVENNTGIIVCISFTMLLIWCEMLLYLRLLSEMAKYIYFVIIIFSTVYPFLVFMFLVITAFAHAFFLLLSNPDVNTIKPRINSFTIINTTSQETLDLEMDSMFNPTSVTDNPFSSFLSSFEAAYFWINGEWAQKDDWDYWAVEVLSLVASILLVTVLQNMLIAFMGGVYEEAAEKGRDALLRYRATLISDYEALEDVRFWPREPDPQFIFYVGHSRSFEEWTEGRKEFKGCVYQRYENRASYKKYKFQEIPSDKYSLLEYKMDRKDSSSSSSSSGSSISSFSGDGKIVPGSSSSLCENFNEFQQTINNKLVGMDQKIDTGIADLRNDMRDFFTEFMKKLDKIENKQE